MLLDAYLDGLADEGAEVDRAAVEAGWAIHLAIRSSISAPVLDPRWTLTDDERAAALARRLAVGRIGIDRVLRLTRD